MGNTNTGYITTNHQGGLCNVMFKLSAAISLALDNNVKYVFSNEFIRQLDREVVCKGFNDYRIYYTNILRNIEFIDTLPSSYRVYNEVSFDYRSIQYTKGENLLLQGYYQSEKYFINNKKFILDLFKPTQEIETYIVSTIPNIKNSISIHIRKGDYIKYPDHHPQLPVEYFLSAVSVLGIDREYLIFSDELESIGTLFDFLPNKKFITLGKDYLDLYAMSMCEHNIISNSTFGWWAAYLNTNQLKQVIAPKRWFGSAYAHYSTQDLIPETWLTL